MSIKDKSLRYLRTKDFLLTALALLLLFVGIPGYVSLLQNWNSTMGYENDYKAMDEDFFDTVNITLKESSFGSSVNSPIVTMATDGTPALVSQYGTILWANGTATNNSMVITGAGTHLGPMWFLPWNISDLIDEGITSFHLIVKLPYLPVLSTLAIWYYEENSGVIDLLTASQGRMAYKTFQTSTIDVYINTTILDLMVDKAEYGNCRIGISVDGSQTMDPGDILQFDFSYYEPTTPEVNENKALQWGGAIGGAILGIIALGSTSLWNPFDKKNPGWIDIQIKKIVVRRKK